jgi:hypothetical protein
MVRPIPLEVIERAVKVPELEGDAVPERSCRVIPAEVLADNARVCLAVDPRGLPWGVTAIPPSGSGLVQGRLLPLNSVFDEVIPLAV